jgi:hypothetical protein
MIQRKAVKSNQHESSFHLSSISSFILKRIQFLRLRFSNPPKTVFPQLRNNVSCHIFPFSLYFSSRRHSFSFQFIFGDWVWRASLILEVENRIGNLPLIFGRTNSRANFCALISDFQLFHNLQRCRFARFETTNYLLFGLELKFVSETILNFAVLGIWRRLKLFFLATNAKKQ